MLARVCKGYLSAAVTEGWQVGAVHVDGEVGHVGRSAAAVFLGEGGLTV